MKMAFRALLIALSLLTGFQQSLIFVHFKLNRQAIERAFCVNKDKPNLQCHGNCYLKKQMQKSTDNSEPVSIMVHPWVDTFPSLTDEMGHPAIRIKSRTSVYLQARYKDPGREIYVPPPIG